jgi:hypothetical protein
MQQSTHDVPQTSTVPDVAGVTPHASAPDHQCIHAGCGCNDGITAGGCSEWCMGNTIEAADLETGKVTDIPPCQCGHETCRERTAKGLVGTGTAHRGMG